MYVILLAIGIFGALIEGAPNNQYGIIGGRNATEGEFPYLVSIQLCFQGMHCDHHCGGAVLSKQWILTSANCYRGDHSDIYNVYAGSVNLKDKKKEISIVYDWFIHPDYDNNTYVSANDIALIKLMDPLNLNNLVQPIKLPESDSVEPKGTATISGWGATFYDGAHAIYPDDLVTIDVPIIDYDACMKIINKESNVAPKYNHSVVCTGPTTGGVGVCHGDSGGPLVQDGVGIGLVSWAPSREGCADVGSVVVFTKLSSYLPWINDIINNN